MSLATNPYSTIFWIVFIFFVSLFVGFVGYYYIAKLSPVDSLLNASMILGGMGPVNTLETTQAKIFASFFAIYSGVFFLVVISFLITIVL